MSPTEAQGERVSVLGARCSACDALAEECQKIHHEYERYLVRQAADLRVQVTQLQALVAELRDPEEKRSDGRVVRRDRWESGVRNIVGVLGMMGRAWEIDEVVEEVRRLAVAGKEKVHVEPSEA